MQSLQGSSGAIHSQLPRPGLTPWRSDNPASNLRRAALPFAALIIVPWNSVGVDNRTVALDAGSQSAKRQRERLPSIAFANRGNPSCYVFLEFNPPVSPTQNSRVCG